MAFAVKYRMDFTDNQGQDSYRLDIETDGYGGAVIQLGHTIEGFELTYNESPWIQGFEGMLSFHLEEADITAYDADFYNSEYRDFKVKFYINSVLKNVGWLKPENTTREVIGPVVQYRVSFTDALNDLQNIDYTGFESTGRQTLLQVIKNVLAFGEITDLDLFLQCNLYEDILMTPTDTLFKTFLVPNGAFYDVKDGETVPDKCFTVLEKCIKPFYCRLAQVNGYWQLTNGGEYESQRDIYAYADLAAVSENAAYDRRVDISDFHVKDSRFNLSKAPPVHILRVTFRNKNIGTNEVTDGGFDSGGTASWNNGPGSEAWVTFTVTNGELILAENSGTGDPDADKSFTSDPFNIADIGDGDGFFNWKFKLKLNSISYATGDYITNPPFFKVKITYPDATSIETGLYRIEEGETTYELDFPEKFPVDQVGNYTFTIIYVSPNTISSSATLNSIQLNVDNIEVTQNATTGEVNDKTYHQSSDAPGYLAEEEELFFADGSQLSDSGALVDNTSTNEFSSSWTRYGVSAEGDSLITQFTRQYLNDRRGYFDKITIDGLIDYNEEIHFNSILQFNSKTYRFLEFSKNFKTKTISGTIQQVNNGAVAEVAVTGSIRALLARNGLSLSDLKRINVPGATPTIDGLVTTGDQAWEGVKTFQKPIKLTSTGSLGDTPLDGQLEYIGDNLYFTTGGVRYQISPSGDVSVDTTGATLTLNFNSGWEGFFYGSASFATPKTLVFSNESAAKKFTFVFVITNIAAELTLPSSFLFDNALWERSSDNVWSPLDTGKYLMHGRLINGDWFVDITRRT